MDKIFILFIISVLVLQTVCFATGKGTREVFTSGLNLTKDQSKEISFEKSKMQKEVAGLKKSVAELKNLITTELRKDTPNQNGLYSYIKEMNNLQAQIRYKRIDFLLKKRSLLTEEQREKYKRMFFGGENERD